MDRRRRRAVLAGMLVLLSGFLGVQYVTADAEVVRSTDAAYPGDTLIAVQSYEWFGYDNGEAMIVSQTGEVEWRFNPPDSRVFDVERLPNGNVQAAVATRLPAEECPTEHQGRTSTCVENRVVEVDYPGTDIVWEYSWLDAFVAHHEVHDADRLPSGEIAIADMGNDRVFTVAPNGTITWEWDLETHLGEGSDFWETYVPEGAEGQYRKGGPESDWTHVNDVDHLPNGNLQLSVRNFDVVIEVDRTTDEIVDVFGSPGNHDVLREQHNPNRLENGTLLVADSENDRVVEFDNETGEPLWSYGQGLAWPRDADRLPNGNTLIVDSRNFRVLEVTPAGEVAWEYSLAGSEAIVYDADRLGPSEEPGNVPAAASFERSGPVGSGSDLVVTIESWAGFLFPPWVRFPELLAIAGSALVGLALAIDGGLYFWRARPWT